MTLTSNSFKQLIVWQKAHAFVLDIYKLTESFPRHEQYALTSQIRRASVSVAANICEGYRRKSTNEKYRFFNIAQASLCETHYFLILGHDLNYCNSFSTIEKMEELKRILDAYTNKLNPHKP